MASSAEPRRGAAPRRWALGPALVAAASGVALSGCVSTQQKAAWAHIEDARIIATQSPLVVRRAGREVRVTGIALMQNGARLAIAVRLHNTTAHPLNDIPISVGLRRGRTETYLNSAAGLDYFETHVAEIPVHGTETWVFTANRPLRLAGRPFAVPASESSPPITVARAIPRVHASLYSEPRRSGDGLLRIAVTNMSGVPQVDLQLYAVAVAAGRYSAAGSATVADLSGGQSTTTSLALVGRLRGARVELEALPTLFH